MSRTPSRATRLAVVGSMLACAVPAAGVEPDTRQTIVLMRHGERAARGLGQLDCQGLNRALAIPGMLAKRFGRPDALFAPSPSFIKEDFGISYSYVRPLATIEPTAIRFDLPVDATVGYSEVGKLEKRLQDPALRKALVVIAWEHKYIVQIARDLLTAAGGDARVVPPWDRNDFDGLYVLRISRTGGTAGATFEVARQGLDGQPKECPAR